MIRAESASISEQPDRTLAIARTIPPDAFLPCPLAGAVTGSTLPTRWYSSADNRRR